MKRYFPHIKRYSWVVLTCFLIAAAGGYILAKAQPTAYLVNASLLVDSGAPGTSVPGVTANSSDSIAQAADDAVEIPTRSVMQFVYAKYPEIGQHHYSVDDLTADISVASPSTTTSLLTVTAAATKPSDAVMLVNDVTKGYQAYKLKQLQDQLTTQRNYLATLYNNYKTQSDQLERQILSYGNPSDPHVALLTTNRNSVIQNMNAIQAQLDQLPSNEDIKSDVFITQLAELKDVTSSSKTATVVVATAGVGLLLGIVLMALLIFLDNRLLEEDLVKEKLGLAYLGGLSSNAELRNAATRTPGSSKQEFSDILANLRLTNVLTGSWYAPQGAVLLVTSTQTAEGKTTLVAGLAATASRGGCTVVVVDGNLRKPSTHLAFGISPAGPGLTGMLKGAGAESVDSAVMRSSLPGVWLLTAGARIEDSLFLLQQKFPGILDQLRKRADLVIIDGPALLSGADAALLATMVDGVAVVLDTRHDKLPILVRAKEVLTGLTRTPAGVVLNHTSHRKRNHYYASAFPGETIAEEHLQVVTPANGGYGNGRSSEAVSGERVEQVAVAFPTIPSSPGSTQVVMGSAAPTHNHLMPTGRPELRSGSGLFIAPPLHPGKDG